MESLNPYTPRGIKVHGLADIVEREGRGGMEKQIRSTPPKNMELWNFGAWFAERRRLENTQNHLGLNSQSVAQLLAR